VNAVCTPHDTRVLLQNCPTRAHTRMLVTAASVMADHTRNSSFKRCRSMPWCLLVTSVRSLRNHKGSQTLHMATVLGCNTRPISVATVHVSGAAPRALRVGPPPAPADSSTFTYVCVSRPHLHVSLHQRVSSSSGIACTRLTGALQIGSSAVSEGLGPLGPSKWRLLGLSRSALSIGARSHDFCLFSGHRTRHLQMFAKITESSAHHDAVLSCRYRGRSTRQTDVWFAPVAEAGLNGTEVSSR
jgi:hypothetical protein